MENQLSQVSNSVPNNISSPCISQGKVLYLKKPQVLILLLAGLPLTQGNSGKFQITENLRETQGSFKI